MGQLTEKEHFLQIGVHSSPFPPASILLGFQSSHRSSLEISNQTNHGP